MTTRVVHINDNIEGAVYVGRAVPRRGIKASKWANPFRISANMTPEAHAAHLAQHEADLTASRAECPACDGRGETLGWIENDITKVRYIPCPDCTARYADESQRGPIDYQREYLADPAADLDPRADPHCPVCHGTGRTLSSEGDDTDPCACVRDLCPACDGQGERPQWQCDGLEMLPCPDCTGSGFVPDPPPAPTRTPEDDGVPF